MQARGRILSDAKLPEVGEVNARCWDTNKPSSGGRTAWCETGRRVEGTESGLRFFSGGGHAAGKAGTAAVDEEVVALVVYEDERGEIGDFDLPYRFHAEFGILQHFDFLDVLLGEDGSRTADAAEVKAAVVFAGFGDLRAAIALGEHHHRAAERLEEVNIAVHATGRSGAKTTARVTLRCLGGACIVDRVVFEIIGQSLAGIHAFLEFGVGNVAGDDERAVEQHARGHGMPSQLGEDRGHWLVQVDAHNLVVLDRAGARGDEAAGIGFELFEPDAVFVDLGFDVAVGGAGHAEADGAAGTVARQTDDAHVEGEILAAELRADAAVLGDLEDELLRLQIAEGAAFFVTGGGKVVVVFGRGELDGFQAGLGAGATYDEGEVIGRAGGGAEVGELVGDELFEALGVEQRLCLLKEERLVGRAAAFGDEEEFILGTFGGVEVDLRRQVGAGVDLVEHVQRRGLRITQVFLGVGLVDALGNKLGVVGAGPDLLAFFGDHRGGAGVLAEGENAFGRDLGVLQERGGDVAVVGRGLGVVEDGGNLCEVLRAKEEGRVAHRLLRNEGEDVGVNLEDFATLEGRGGDAFFRKQAILGVVRAEREGVLVGKSGRGHGGQLAISAAPGTTKNADVRKNWQELRTVLIRAAARVRTRI